MHSAHFYILVILPPPSPSISKGNRSVYFEYDENRENIDAQRTELGTVTLAGSNNRLDISGDYTGGATVCNRLIVGSDSVIHFWWEEDPADPGGFYHPYLHVENLEIVGNSAVILEGDMWLDSDRSPLMIKDYGRDISNYFSHIKARVGSELKNTVWGRGPGYYYISGYAPWTPVPESETYGAIFGAVGLGLVIFRRRVWACEHSLTGHRSP